MERRLERSHLTIGIVPLTDCAPIVVAQERGFFRRHGLTVEISCEPSWATVRDKIAVGALDAAQMLAGMPLAAMLGLGGLRRPVIAPMVLDTNGNAITVGAALYARMAAVEAASLNDAPGAARALRCVIAEERAAGRRPLTFAVPFPVATHNYELRLWLASAGIDPARDLRIVVVPPPEMVANLAGGRIDGFCVGEPWNGLAARRGIGCILASKSELMNNAPEKVLGVAEAWASRHPATLLSLVAALIDANRWIDQAENREEVARLLADSGYVEAPADIIAASLTGDLAIGPAAAPRRDADFHVFFRYAACFPWRSYADWTVAQMLRWGQVGAPLDIRRTADRAFRPDIFRAAAQRLGLAVPPIDRRPIGLHAGPWQLAASPEDIAMPGEATIEARIFDPADPIAYLAALEVADLRVPLAALALANQGARDAAAPLAIAGS